MADRSIARRLILALYNIDEVYLLNEKMKKVSAAELCLMYALDDGKPHSQREISVGWQIPKTTVNTITKRRESEGMLIQTPIPGKRREMQITLTEKGKAYAKEFLAFLYQAEDMALARTLDKYGMEFIDAIEFFGASLKEAFEEVNKVGSAEG